MEFDKEFAEENNVAASAMEPHPASYPYLLIRVMPGVYHQFLIFGNDTEEELIRKAKAHPAAKKLRCCLVLGPEDGIYFTPEGGMNRSRTIPAGGRLVYIPIEHYRTMSGDIGAIVEVVPEETRQDKEKRGSIIRYDNKTFSSKVLLNGDESHVLRMEAGEGVTILSYALIIKVESIVKKFAGGWAGFLDYCKAKRYQVVTDGKLATVIDGEFSALLPLVDNLHVNGLQWDKAPVDFYAADPTFYSMAMAMALHHSKDQDKGIFLGDRVIGTNNDFEIEIFLEDSGKVRARLKESYWHKYNEGYDTAVGLYILGDVVGSPFEATEPLYREWSLDEIIRRYRKAGTRTDESDLVDCFNKFMEDYDFRVEERCLLDWAVFISKNKSVVKYGKAFPDFFRTVGALEANNTLSVERLYDIAVDRNSCGNGCLSLVLPVYHLGDSLNIGKKDKHRLIVDFCRLTHAHELALQGVSFLFMALDITLNDGDPFALGAYGAYDKLTAPPLKTALAEFLGSSLTASPEEFIKRYNNNSTALNTVFYALYCVRNAASLEEVAVRVVTLGGDVDSVNALAFMLWGLLHPSAAMESLTKWQENDLV